MAKVELRDFGSTLPPDTAPKEAFEENARKLHSSIRSLNQDFPVLAGTLLLYLAGRFENFVRNAFESVCDTQAAKCTTFDELLDKMKQSLISSTATILASPGRYGFDSYTQVYSFIVNLSANIQAKAGLGPINSACLSITDHNMNAKMLAELYQRVGINALWEEIGKQSKIKIHFETGRDADAATSAKSVLNEIMNTRNQIAHPSAITTFPAPDKVMRYAEFLRVLSEVLTEVCRVHLTVFRAGV